MKLYISVFILTLLACSAAAGSTVPIVSATCSGEYNGQYACSGAIDGIVNDTVTNSSGNASYWLGRQTTANETLTVDLGSVDTITGFDIYNTHNGVNCCSNDRGTLAFEIWVSMVPVTPDTTSTSFGTEVLNSTLVFVVFPNFSTDPNQVQVFSIDPTLGRYVTFRTLSFPIFYAGSGLSELQVEGTATPEPTTVLLMAGALAAIYSFRRKRSRT